MEILSLHARKLPTDLVHLICQHQAAASIQARVRGHLARMPLLPAAPRHGFSFHSTLAAGELVVLQFSSLSRFCGASMRRNLLPQVGEAVALEGGVEDLEIPRLHSLLELFHVGLQLLECGMAIAPHDRRAAARRRRRSPRRAASSAATEPAPKGADAKGE